MLLTDYDEQEGITVPYPPLYDDIRNNHGFVDLRGRPDLAASVAEGIQSQALRSMLTEMAKTSSPFFTVGCDLGSHEEEDNLESRYVAGGYIQILDSNYSDKIPNDYLSLAYAINNELEKDAEDHNWISRFVHTSVMFNLDGFNNVTSSLWIWFYACSSTPTSALDSREIYIRSLQNILGNMRNDG